MLLSDRSIEDLLEQGEITVDPAVEAEQIQPASLDVRFGNELYDVANDELMEIEYGEEHVLEPGVPYLGHTQDVVDIPNYLASQLTGRSSYGRLFVTVHQTAGWLDPGFKGDITLEIYNLNVEPIEIEAGERVGQMVFFWTDRRTRGYDGQYQGQRGITRSGYE